jgi:DNA polymerase-3 subunit delta
VGKGGPSPTELLGQIGRGDIAPLWVLFGPERHLRERVVLALKAAVTGGSDLAIDRLDARDAKASGVLAAARTLPMLVKRRFVLVRDLEAFSAADLEALVPYARQPNPSTCLVLVGEKADLRYKFFTEAARTGVVARFDPLGPRELPAWLQREARALSVTLEEDAATTLVDAVGRDLGELCAALERVALYVDAGPRATIRSADVEAAVGSTRSRSVFDLTDALGRRDRSAALEVLHRMLADRENAHGILAMLARHLRQVWIARELRAAGAPPPAIAAEAGVPPFVAQKLLDQAARFTPEALAAAHRALVEADRLLKSSRAGDGPILEGLIVAMASEGSAPTRPRGSQRP